jgi:hypothetical protein
MSDIACLRRSPYNVGVNRYETALFVAFLPFYLLALSLYHFMIMAVNRRLDLGERVPHSLFWHGWNRVRNNYKTLYPRYPVYQLSVLCAATAAGIAVLFVALRIWEYAHALP